MTDETLRPIVAVVEACVREVHAEFAPIREAIAQEQQDTQLSENAALGLAFACNPPLFLR